MNSTPPLTASDGIDSTPAPTDLASQVERVAAPLREQVSDILRTEIVEMRLRPGQRIGGHEPIRQLIEDLALAHHHGA